MNNVLEVEEGYGDDVWLANLPDEKDDPFYDPRNIAYLEKQFQDLREGKMKFVVHDLIYD